MVERMGLRQVFVAFTTTRQVTFARAHDALKVIFELSRLRYCHVTLHCLIFLLMLRQHAATSARLNMLLN